MSLLPSTNTMNASHGMPQDILWMNAAFKALVVVFVLMLVLE